MSKNYTINYQYVQPSNPPNSTDWPVELDYPGVRVLVVAKNTYDQTVQLPEIGSYLRVTTRASDTADAVFRAPTLAEAESKARAAGEAIERRLGALDSERELREKQRAETIARAHAHVSTIKPE